MTTEHVHAMVLLKVLRDRVLTGQKPINGYHNAAEAIGLNGNDYQRHLGQVCSRIDVAAFNAGYPMLATHMVRTPEGDIHPSAFNQPVWQDFKDESIEVAATHQWTPEQLDEVRGALAALKPVGALALWRGIEAREMQKTGFIRYNLHRKLRNLRPT